VFKRLFGGRKAEAAPQLCMPLLVSAEGLSPARLVGAWRKLFPALPPPEADAGGEEGVMSFRVGGASAFVAVMPGRVPTGEVEEAAKLSWMWKKEGDAALAAYGAHAVVAAAGAGESPVENAVLVTRVVACVVEAGSCVAVYWGNGSLVHMPGLFKDMAVEMMEGGSPVPPLWVNVLVSSDGPRGPFSLSTLGMEKLGHNEFEIVAASTDRPGDLRMRLYEVAAYVLENGPVLKDGDTLGDSPEERIRVRVGRSRLGKPGRVVRLEM